MRLFPINASDNIGFQPPKGKLDTQMFPECEGTEYDRNIVRKTVEKRKKDKKKKKNKKKKSSTVRTAQTTDSVTVIYFDQDSQKQFDIPLPLSLQNKSHETIADYVYRNTQRVSEDSGHWIDESQKAEQMNLRSSMVGDVFVIEGTPYVVCTMGFAALTPEQFDKWKYVPYLDRIMNVTPSNIEDLIEQAVTQQNEEDNEEDEPGFQIGSSNIKSIVISSNGDVIKRLSMEEWKELGQEAGWINENTPNKDTIQQHAAEDNDDDEDDEDDEWDPNPWAVCHTTVDKDKEPEKFERCVQQVKEKQSSSVKAVKVSADGQTVKISRDKWDQIGRKAGWTKSAQDNDFQENDEKITKIISDIRNGQDPYFGLSAFHASNLADPTMLKATIEDIAQVHDIAMEDAATIVQTLSHGDAPKNDDEDFEDIDEFDEKNENISPDKKNKLPPSEPGWD